MALAVALLASGCDVSSGPARVDNDPYLVVTAYVDALNARDADAIRELVNPRHDAGAEIESRIDSYGGRSLYYRTMTFNGTGMAGATSVDLVLRSGSPGDTREYRDALSLSLHEGHWYLDLGQVG